MTTETLTYWSLGIFGAVLLAEIIGGWHKRSSWRDKLFPVAGFSANILFASPIIALILSFPLAWFLPDSKNALVGLSFWIAFPVFFLTEEFLHYWIHRWAHLKPWLWKLHRTHHTAENLNASVVFRYNLFWTLLLPQTWSATLLLHFGLTEVFAVNALTVLTINVLTHTSYRWDLALRRLPGMNAVFSVVEKIITLPDAHHAHHGLGKQSHMNGNYAVTFFIFDILLGTAKLPNARQERYGLPMRFDWKEELLWPVFRAPAIDRSQRRRQAAE